MRLSIIALLTLTLAACAPPASAPPSASSAATSGCARSATHAIAFSAQQPTDVITTRADGPTCKQAVVTFVLRDGAGDPMWTLANTYYDMTAGGTPPPDAPAVTDAQMDTFLSGWANVTMRASGDLPEWPENVAALPTSFHGMSYNTELPRESYEMLRQRNLPLLCYAAAAEATQCLIMDPATGSPTMIVAYGP